MEHCDILISGGGIAGLIATAAFGAAGRNVLCVDPAPPVTERDADGADLRSTALLQPARDLLEQIDLWPEMEPHGTALDVMRIVDADGPEPALRHSRSFQSRDVSDKAFGWNFPNWLLRRVLIDRLNSLENVRFESGIGAARFLGRANEARVSLSDGRQVSARLVVAADGRHSPMRKSAGIAVRTRRYGQKALAFAVTHPIPHENVSTEIHCTGGPFTLVPLPDYEGHPSSAVVWMDDGPACVARMDMAQAEFETEMTARSCQVLGPLTLASRRTMWPIISQQAESLTATRLALVAEAAHVVPPIGAQGLNMSLADIGTLYDLAKSAPDDPGNPSLLKTYETARIRDMRLRVAGIDLLNRASQVTHPGLRALRGQAMTALHDIKPLRKLLMQTGLGLRKIG